MRKSHFKRTSLKSICIYIKHPRKKEYKTYLSLLLIYKNEQETTT